MNEHREAWACLVNGPQSKDRLGVVMWRVSSGLSQLIGRTIINGEPRIDTVPLTEVPARAGGPEAETVGVYLAIQGGLHGQAMLILPLDSALNLADGMMDNAPGTATRLDAEESSALAELGNLTLSYFLNATAAYVKDQGLLRPSPPAVMVDMLGAILNVVVAPVAAVRDDLLIIETPFSDGRNLIQGSFWVMPDPSFKPASHS